MNILDKLYRTNNHSISPIDTTPSSLPLQEENEIPGQANLLSPTGADKLSRPDLYPPLPIESFIAEEEPVYYPASRPPSKSKKSTQKKSKQITTKTASTKMAKPNLSSMTPKADKTYTSSFNPDDFIGTAFHDAAYFCKLFKPYKRHYLKKVTYAGKSHWIHQPSTLSLKRIQSTITNGYEVGWLSSFRTPALGLDLDLHHLPHNDCWLDFTPNPHLIDLYYEIINIFDYYPSLICKSPRGLHIYYLLYKPVEYDNLKLLAKSKLSVISSPIEIKPSPKTGLRIPVQKWILDPETLNPIGDTPIKWETITQFSTEELFGPNYRKDLRYFNFNKPQTPAQHTCTSSTPTTSTPSSPRNILWKNVLQAEKELLPFTNHSSNEILCQLIPKYRACNLSMQSVIDLLWNHINKSPGYTNELTDFHTLERRVIDFYNCKQDTYTPESPKITILPEHIEQIVRSHTFPKQRTKGIRQYFLGLLNWKALHDQALTNYRFRVKMDDMYPYYSINRKNGFYPLPSKIQRSWNKNYNSLLPWLLEKGILKDSGLPYSPGAHICKYYEINL